MARTGWLIAAALLVVSLLSFSPEALARDKPVCTAAKQPACTIEQARAECMSHNPLPWDNWVEIISRRCVNLLLNSAGDVGRFSSEFIAKRHNGSTTPWTGDASSFNWAQSCKDEASYTGVGPWSSDGGSATPGSVGCRNGCDGVWQKNADFTQTWTALGNVCPDDQEKNCQSPAMAGAGYYWNPVLRVCEPPDIKCQGGAKPNSLGQCGPEPCPEGRTLQQDGTCKTKENECPAGQIRSPDGKCLPGDGQCAAGEVRGPDGTCKKDSDGDGDPDDPGDKETFSGGDDCAVPPSCSGSPILCGQARIQWRIDCNTRKNRNIAGGTCAAMPVCTGEKCDAMEYASLLMQWRTACATEKLLTKDGGNGGDGSQPEWTKVTGMSTDPGAGSSPDDINVVTTKKIGISDLDQSGVGGSGSCMGFVTGGGAASSLSSGFMQVMSSPPAFFCNFISQIRAVIILLASVTCVYILSRGAP